MNKRQRISVLIMAMLMLMVFSVTGSAASKTTTQKMTLYVGQIYVMPSPVPGETPKWKSSKRSVVTAAASGELIAVKKGTATVTATAGGQKFKWKVTVKKCKTDEQRNIVRESRIRKYLGQFEKYSQIIQQDYRDGNYWTYARSGVSATFEKARAKNNRKTSCAYTVNFVLRALGYLKTNQTISTDGVGNFRFKSKTGTEKQLKKTFKVVDAADMTPAELYAAGKLLPGDILGYRLSGTHMNVFAGADSNGNLLFYDTGRMGTNGEFIEGSEIVDGHSLYRFYTGGPFVENLPIRVHQILRMK